MIWLRQSTASQIIPLGAFLDSTDGDTEETALTIANTDIKIWKAGATALVNKNSGGATHMSNGEYYCTLDATDTNTLGRMKVRVHVTGALYVQVYCFVFPANVYDSLVAGTDNLDVNVVQWLGTAAATPATAGVPSVDAVYVSGDSVAADNLEADYDGTGYNKSNSTLGTVTALSAAGIDSIFDEALSGHTTAGTAGWNLALAGAILVDTTITGTPTSTTFQLTAGSAIDDFYNDQLVYIVSGTGVGQVRPISDYTGATKTVTVDEVFATTPAAADRVVIQSTHVHPLSQVADKVLDEALSGHTTAGTLGKAVADIETDATAILADTADMQPKLGTPVADISADIATVDANVDAILVDTGTTIPATLGTPAADVSADIAAVLARTLTAANLAKLEKSVGTIVTGTAQTGTLSTTQMSSDLTEATDDHYIGRTVIWTSGALINQASDITDYTGTGGILTYTAVTEAPSNGDTFVIV